jgi:hypothetical protein
LPFHMPKLTAVALGRLTGDDFATRLDRAVEQSEKARRFTRLIELTVAKVVDPESE